MLQVSCRCQDLNAGMIRILDLFRRIGFQIESLHFEAGALNFRIHAVYSNLTDTASEQLAGRLGEIVGVEEVVITRAVEDWGASSSKRQNVNHRC